MSPADRALRAGLVIALAIAGCRKAPEVRRPMVLGTHHISVAVPAGYQVLEFGREARVSRGGVVLTFGELGPLGAEGIGREVERARSLWRAGKPRDAQWVLKCVPVPDTLFRTLEERRSFWSAWSDVAQAPESTPGFVIEEAFDRVQAGVDAFVRPDPATLAAEALSRMDTEKHRQIAERSLREAGGRTIVVFRTWDKLSHARPRRVAIAIDRGYGLVLNTETGPIAIAALPFEALLASLTFEDGDSTGTATISGAPPATGP